MSQHPHDPLPGGALLGAQHAAQVGEHQELVRQAVLAEGAAPHLPAARAAGKGRLQGAGRFTVEEVTQADGLRLPAEQPLGGLAQKPLAAAVHQPEAPSSIEGEDGDVDLLDHPPEERGGLELPEPLSRERLAQRVHLQQRQTERVVRSRRPARGSSSRPRAAPRAGWRWSAAGG